MVDSQQGLIPEIIKTKSKRVSFSFSRSNNTPKQEYTGFPLKFFENQSYLERIAEWFSTAPFFLSHEVVSANTEAVFRMKQTISMVISTLYMTVKPSKPFNPMLGETYQGYLYSHAPTKKDIS